MATQEKFYALSKKYLTMKKQLIEFNVGLPIEESTVGRLKTELFL